MISKIKFYPATYEASDQLIKQIFNDFPFSLRGKKIFLKPNLLAPHPKEKGVTTHPSLIKSITEYLLSCGAEVKVGDNPSLISSNAMNEVAEITGVKSASLGCFVDISKDVTTVKSEVGEVLVSKAILDADLVISLPKLKTHLLTTFTLSIKNMFGILVGNQKSKLHYQFPTPLQFSEALLAIYEIRKPDLNIIDGILAMEGNGPSQGSLRNLNTVIVSENGYAADWAIISHLLNINPLKIPYLKFAVQRNLFNPNKFAIEGEYKRVNNFKLPFATPQMLTLGKNIIKTIYHPFRYKRIKINQSKCRLCEECVKICPVRALKIEKKRLHYQKNTCFACFCCYEACAYGAIRV